MMVAALLILLMLNFAAFHAALLSMFRTQAALQLETLALRQQIGVLQRSTRKRPRLTAADLIFFAWLSGIWKDWRSALAIFKPATVIGWHRTGFDLAGPTRADRPTRGSAGRS